MSKALSNQLKLLRKSRSALAAGDLEEYERLNAEADNEVEEGLEEEEVSTEPADIEPVVEEVSSEEVPSSFPPAEPSSTTPTPLEPIPEVLQKGEIPGAGSPTWVELSEMRGEGAFGTAFAHLQDFVLENAREGGIRAATPLKDRKLESTLGSVENLGIAGALSSKGHPYLAAAAAVAGLYPAALTLSNEVLGTNFGEGGTGFGGDPLDLTQWLGGVVLPRTTAQDIQDNKDRKILKTFPKNSPESRAARERLKVTELSDIIASVVQLNNPGEVASGYTNDRAYEDDFINAAGQMGESAHKVEALKMGLDLASANEAIKDRFSGVLKRDEIKDLYYQTDWTGRGRESGVNISGPIEQLTAVTMDKIRRENPGISAEELQARADKHVETEVQLALQNHPFAEGIAIINIGDADALKELYEMEDRWGAAYGELGRVAAQTLAPIYASMTPVPMTQRMGLMSPEQVYGQSSLVSGLRLANLAPTTWWAAGSKFDKYPVVGPLLSKLGLIDPEDAVLSPEELAWMMEGGDVIDAAPHAVSALFDHIYPDAAPGSDEWNAMTAQMQKDHPFLTQAPIIAAAMFKEPDALSMMFAGAGKFAKVAKLSAKSIKFKKYIENIDENILPRLQEIAAQLEPYSVKSTDAKGTATYTHKDVPIELEDELGQAIQALTDSALKAAGDDPELQAFFQTNLLGRLKGSTGEAVRANWQTSVKARRALSELKRKNVKGVDDALKAAGHELRALEAGAQAADGILDISTTKLRMVVEALRDVMPEFFEAEGLNVAAVKNLSRKRLQTQLENATRDTLEQAEAIETLKHNNSEAWATGASMFARLQEKKALLEQAVDIAKRGLAVGDEVEVFTGVALDAGKFIEYKDVDGVKRAFIRIETENGSVVKHFDIKDVAFDFHGLVNKLNPAHGAPWSEVGKRFRDLAKATFFKETEGAFKAADGSIWVPARGLESLKEGQIVRWLDDGELKSVEEMTVKTKGTLEDGTDTATIFTGKTKKPSMVVTVPLDQVYTLRHRDAEEQLDGILAILEARARAATMHRGEKVTEEAINAWYARNFKGFATDLKGEVKPLVDGSLPVIDELSPYGIQKNIWRINQRLKNAKKLNDVVAAQNDKAEADMVARLGRALTDEEETALYVRIRGPHQLAQKQAEIAEARQALAGATGRRQKEVNSDLLNKLLAEEKKLQDDFIDILGEKEAKSVLTEGVDRANKAIDLDIEKRSEWRGLDIEGTAHWTQVERFAKEYAGGRIPKDDPEALQFLTRWGEKVEEATAALKKPADEVAAQGDVLDDIMYQGPATAGATTAEEAVEAARSWKELGTESPYFKKWFGDSKIVGEDGKPLVVFHGSPHGGFTEFEELHAWHFFAGERSGAATYAKTDQPIDFTRKGDQRGIYDVYLKSSNPFEVDYKGGMWDKPVTVVMGGKKVKFDTIEDLAEAAEEAGHDGVKVLNIKDFKGAKNEDVAGPAYIVFNNANIKSTANRGTFDETGRILYQGEDVASVDDIVKVLLQEGDEGARMPWERGDPTTRVPELAAAAKKILAGTADAPTRAQYQKLVDEYKPVYPYASVPAPATRADMVRGLSASDKKKVEKIDGAANLEAGTVVGLRLDIPAYKREKVWVPTIHRRSTVIGHHAAAAVDNVKLTMGGTTALKIAAGEIAKTPFATIKGGWSPATTEDLVAEAEAALKSDDWVQVGMDPERHSFFYDRKTQQPLGSADRVIQIGPLVLAKNAKPLGPKKEARLLYQDAEEVPVFYSKLIETTQEMPKRMLIGDYEKWLYKRGVKEVEVNATNLDVYLEELASKGEKFAYKADLEKFLDENQVKVTLQDFGKSAPSGRLLTPYTGDLTRVERKLSQSIKFANLPYTFSYRLFEQTNEGVQEFLQSPSRFKKQRSELVEDLDELLNVYNQIVHNPDFTAGTDAATRKLQGDVRRLIVEHGEADYTQVGKGVSREKLKEVQNVLGELGTTEQVMRKAYATSNMLDTRDQLTFMQSLIDSKDFKEYARLRDLQQKYVAETETLKGTRYQKWVQDGYDDYQELIIELDNPRVGDFDTPHFNRTNILAHARMTSRTTPEGKKVLMIDELQSDWHQAGRQYGYKGSDPLPELREEIFTAADSKGMTDEALGRLMIELENWVDGGMRLEALTESGWKLGDDYTDTWTVLTNAEKDLGVDIFPTLVELSDVTLIPDAPFKSTSAWLTLLMKPIMKRAADEGYDAVAITPPQWAEEVGMPADAAKAFYGQLPLTEKQFRAKAVREVKDWDDDILAETFDEYARVAILNETEGKFSIWTSKLSEGLSLREHSLWEDWLNGGMSFSPQELFARLMDSYGEDFATDLAVKAYSETTGYSEAADPLVGIKGIVSGVLKKYTKGKIYTGKVSASSSSRARTTLERFLADDVFEPVMMMDLTDKVKARVGKVQLPLFQKPSEKLPPKAAVQFVEDNKAILYAFEQADVSSLLHEIGHVFRRDLLRSGWQGKLDSDVLVRAFTTKDERHIGDTVTFDGGEGAGWTDLTKAGKTRTPEELEKIQSKRSSKRQAALDKIAQAAEGISGPATWTVKSEERFARAFENYLSTGKSPSLELDGVFKKFRSWLTEIYVKIAGSAIKPEAKPKVKDAVREVFDRMLTGAMTTEGYMKTFTKNQMMSMLDSKGIVYKSKELKESLAKKLSAADLNRTAEYRRFIKRQDDMAKQAAELAKLKASTVATRLAPEQAKLVKSLEEELEPLHKKNNDARTALLNAKEKLDKAMSRSTAARRKLILRNVYDEQKSGEKVVLSTQNALIKFRGNPTAKAADHLAKQLVRIEAGNKKIAGNNLLAGVEGAIKDLKVMVEILKKEQMVRPARRNLMTHPMLKSVIRDRGKGTWIIDPKEFVDSVDKFYVSGVLEEFLATPEGLFLSPIVKAAQQGNTKLTYTKAQMNRLQKTLKAMEGQYRAGELSQASMGAFLQMQRSYKNPRAKSIRVPVPFSDMVGGKGVLLNVRGSATRRFWHFYNVFDPTYSKLGQISPKIAKIASKQTRFVEHGLGDMHNLNMTHMGEDFLGAHVRYMDSTEAIKGRYGSTTVNTLGRGIFKEAQNFIRSNIQLTKKGRATFTEDAAGQYTKSLVNALERTFLNKPELKLQPRVSEAQATKLRPKVLELLSDENMTYDKFLRELGKAAGRSEFGRQDARGIMMSSRALLDAAAQQHTLRAMANTTSAMLTSEEALTMTRFMEGEMDKASDVDLLWSAAAKLGMDLSEGTIRAGTKHGQGEKARIKSLVRWNLDDGRSLTPEELVEHNTKLTATLKEKGVSPEDIKAQLIVSGQKITDPRQVFMPSQIGDAMRDSNRSFVKELDQYYSNPKGFDPQARIAKFVRYWKGMITSGLGLPRPKYYVNNILGDFSQMWQNHGIFTAGKVSAQNTLSNIPYIGPSIQNVTSKMAQKFEGIPILSTAVESVFNPQIGRIFTGEEGVAKFWDGDVSLSTLRENLALDGVLDTFTSREVSVNANQVAMELLGDAEKKYGKSIPDKFKARVARRLKHDVDGFAVQVQQRQRVGLYLELRKQGLDHDGAVKGVKDALYDWSQGFSSWEQSWQMGIVIPFYRFWRLAAGQMIRAFMEPFVMDSSEYMLKALTGQTQLARMKNQGRALSGIPKWAAYAEAEEAPNGEEDEVFWDGILAKPWWIRPGMTYAGKQATQRQKDFMLQDHGRDIDTIATAMSAPMTAAEMYTIGTYILTTPFAAFAAAMDEDKKFNGLRAQKQLEKFAVDIGGPFVEALLKEKRTSKTGYRRISPGQESALKLLGDAADIHRDEEGRLVADEKALLFINNLPVIGSQWADGVNGMEWSKLHYEDEDLFNRILYMLSHISGPVRDYASSTDATLSFAHKDVIEKIKTAADKQKVGDDPKETYKRMNE